MELDYTGLDEATIALLKTDGVKAAIKAAHDKEVSSLKGNRDQIIAEKNSAEATLKEMEKLGGLSELQKLKDLTKNKDKDLTSKDTELADLRKQVETIRSTAQQKEIQAELSRAISDHKGSIALLEPHMKNRVKFVEDRLVVLDKYGQPSDKSISDLVSEYKADTVFGVAFAANPSSGGGAGPTLGKTVSDNPFASGASYNVTKQMAMITNDKPSARKAAIEAGVKLAGLTD